MENKHNMTTDKKEEVIQKVKQLEAEIMAVKDELRTVENEEKLSYHKINVSEVRKDKLSQSIQFYTNKAQKMSSTLSQRVALYTKFFMADVCYDKLLNVYRENYLQDESKTPLSRKTALADSTNGADFKKQNENFQIQVDDLKERIDEHSSILKSLLQDLQYPID